MARLQPPDFAAAQRVLVLVWALGVVTGGAASVLYLLDSDWRAGTFSLLLSAGFLFMLRWDWRALRRRQKAGRIL